MPLWHIRLFGQLCVIHEGRSLEGLDASPAQELLCYLLLHRLEQHSRETLATTLWGDAPTSKSKKRLRQTLWQLQKALHARDEHHLGDIVAVEGDWIRLATNEDLWLDVAQFEEKFALCKGVPGRELDQDRVQALRAATHLYRGDLLHGWYQDWCLCERERLQDMYLAMLDKLMAHAESSREYETAIADGVQILRYNRAHERTHRRLMRLYYLADDRTAALRQYDQCVTALNDELGVRPAKQTVAVYAQIRADCLDGVTSYGALGEVPETAAAQSSVPGRLDDLQRVLVSLHNQMTKALSEMEELLTDPR
jgi:DNA-binding SARP family transcriptional activator